VYEAIYSLDEQIIEGFLKLLPLRVPPPPALFVMAAVATAVLPLESSCGRGHHGGWSCSTPGSSCSRSRS